MTLAFPSPKVTVLMPVFNGEAHLRAAIDSILTQTFSDFELLIIDDGSTDRSADIVASYDDARIRFFRHPENRRLIATLNHGLGLARGEYVARMDADDISLPARLERQVAYLDHHPEVGMCGTWAEVIDEPARRFLRHATVHDAIRCRLLFGCEFVHSSVMMRRRMFEAHGLLYDPRYVHAEDFQLWQRAAEAFPVVNLPEVLVQYRIVLDGICHKYRLPQLETLRVIDAEAMARFGLSLDGDELTLLRRLDDWAIALDLTALGRIEALLVKLHRHNAETGYFPAVPFDKLLARLWYLALHRTAAKGFYSLGRPSPVPVTAGHLKGLGQWLIIAARYFWHYVKLDGHRAGSSGRTAFAPVVTPHES